MSALPRGFAISAVVSIPVVSGVAGGLVVWWMQDAIVYEMQQKTWLLPLVGGIAIAGVTGYASAKGFFAS